MSSSPETAAVPILNDPRHERTAARLLGLFIAAGLWFVVLPGTFLGVWNLMSIVSNRAPGAPEASWIQAHGQAQLFGWVGSFILGISIYLLPKIRQRGPVEANVGYTIWTLWTVGVFWHWWAVVTREAWRSGLVGSAAVLLLAYLLVMSALVWQPRKTEPRPVDLGSRFGMVGFSGLGVVLLANLYYSIQAAFWGSSPTYPEAGDRALVLLAVWVFVIPVALSYSTRFVHRYLLLPPLNVKAAPFIAPLFLAVAIAALAHRFAVVDVLAWGVALFAVWVMQVFRHSSRTPRLQGVSPYTPLFMRICFAWLPAGATLALLSVIFPLRVGFGGASRHAITVGFVAGLIFTVGPRLLPAFLNSRQLFSTRLMTASLLSLNIGCVLRVICESVAYSSTHDLAWRLLPVSAWIEFAAVLLFALNMAATQLKPAPIWFDPELLNINLSLFWFVNAYPGVRKLLQRAGLRRLRELREIPRDLTLAQESEREGVDAESVLAELKRHLSGMRARPA